MILPRGQGAMPELTAEPDPESSALVAFRRLALGGFVRGADPAPAAPGWRCRTMAAPSMTSAWAVVLMAVPNIVVNVVAPPPPPCGPGTHAEKAGPNWRKGVLMSGRSDPGGGDRPPYMLATAESGPDRPWAMAIFIHDLISPFALTNPQFSIRLTGVLPRHPRHRSVRDRRVHAGVAGLSGNLWRCAFLNATRLERIGPSIAKYLRCFFLVFASRDPVAGSVRRRDC